MSRPANVKLTIAYDGTSYLGWQKTDTGPSVEAALEAVLCQILQHDIRLQAASRTDAGVHASGQVVNFLTLKELPPLDRLQASLNGLLPRDISVQKIEIADASFHPTIDSTGKQYRYHLCYGKTQLPHARLYSWHYPSQLDLALMRQAAAHIIGRRDFKAFCNAKKNEEYADHTREVNSIEIREAEGKCLCFEVSGNHFLYKMVRNIVGTLVYVGCGKIDIAELPAILESADRTRAGVTAPSHGLFLHQVNY